MILGLGNDVIDIARIAGVHARYGARFETRIFTEAERVHADSRGARKLATLAKNFAAKEAVAKALGSGFRGGILMRDIEVMRDDLGKPGIRLHGAAKIHLERMPPARMQARIHLSLSDSPSQAWAIALIEALPA